MFYATRLDKNGNKLTTSYTKEASAHKYGGSGATVTEGGNFAQLVDNSMKIGPEVEGDLVRSILINNGDTTRENGRYVLWGKRDGHWARTGMSFAQYGAANTLMKSLISEYEVLVIIDEPSKETASQTIDEEIGGVF